MNKQELVDAIALAVGTSKAAAGETIDAFVDVVTQAVGARYERVGRTIVIRKATIPVGPTESRPARVPLATAQATGRE